MRGRVLNSDASASQQLDKAQFSMVSCSQLSEGVTLRFPIYDARNVLLLSAGATITASAIQRLVQRGVHAVKVHHSELRRLQRAEGGHAAIPARPSLRELREAAMRLKSEESDANEPSFGSLRCTGTVLKTVVKHGAKAYDREQHKRLAKSCEQIVHQVKKLFDSVSVIKATEIGTLEGISSTALGEMTKDIDLFISTGMSGENDKYPARHSQQTAMLAMAVGTNMGLEKKALIDLAIGCLTHDIGMLHINRTAYDAKPVLDTLSFLEITKHPGITFDLMREVEQLAGASRLVAFQMHERCDGSGYPRRRKGEQIHPLSKIAAVADVFTAMTSPRPHRAAIIPYEALEYLLRGGQNGLFDRGAVRGLLRTVSLFPIGSYVELNDGRVGRVMRSNGDAYTRPIVEVWDRGALNTEPQIVDFSQETQLEIACPLKSLNSQPAAGLETSRAG